MKTLVLKMPFKKNKTMEFHPWSGCAYDWVGSSDLAINGNMDNVNGQVISIYVEGGQLFLQVDKDRWVLDENHVKLSYQHDPASRMTHFLIDDHVKPIDIIYPAWWKDLGHFNASVPEMDEDEDYLAYVFTVWSNNELRQELLAAW